MHVQGLQREARGVSVLDDGPGERRFAGPKGPEKPDPTKHPLIVPIGVMAAQRQQQP